MSRKGLYLIIGLLVVVVAVVGIQLYRAQQKPTGVEIRFGERGISIQEK